MSRGFSIPFSSIIAEEQNYHVNPNSTSNRNHAVQEQLSLLKSAKKNSLHSHAESSKSSNVRRKLKLRKSHKSEQYTVSKNGESVKSISLQNVDKVKEKEIILEYEEGKAHSQRSVLVDRNLSHRNNATSQNPARNIFWSGSKNQRERLKNYQRAKSIEKSENETKEQGEICQETNPNPKENVVTTKQKKHPGEVKSMGEIPSKRNPSVESKLPKIIKKIHTINNLSRKESLFQDQALESPKLDNMKLISGLNLNKVENKEENNSGYNPTQRRIVKRSKHLSEIQAFESKSMKVIITEVDEDMIKNNLKNKESQKKNNSYIYESDRDCSIVLGMNEPPSTTYRVKRSRPESWSKLNTRQNILKEKLREQDRVHNKQSLPSSQTDFSNIENIKEIKYHSRPTTGNLSYGKNYRKDSKAKMYNNVINNENKEAFMKRCDEIVGYTSNTKRPSTHNFGSMQKIFQDAPGSAILDSHEKENKFNKGKSSNVFNKTGQNNFTEAQKGFQGSSVDNKIKFLKNKIKNHEMIRKKNKHGLIENERHHGKLFLDLRQINNGEHAPEIEEEFKKKLLITKKAHLYDLIVQQRVVGKKLPKEVLHQVKIEFNKVTNELKELKLT